MELPKNLFNLCRNYKLSSLSKKQNSAVTDINAKEEVMVVVVAVFGISCYANKK